MGTNVWLGGDGTGTQKNDYSRAANWSLAAVPVDGDDVVLVGASTDVIYWEAEYSELSYSS